MAFEKLGDTKAVTLGGINKTTGKKNPTQLEGYFLRIEERPNKFNKNKPQNFYVFLTPSGEVGLYGKAGLDKEMKKASAFTMTRVTNTEKTLDTGMGNPMIVFEVEQDRTNTMEPTEVVAPQRVTVTEEDLVEASIEDDEEEEVAPPRAAAPVIAARPPTSANAAKVQELLNRSRNRSA